MGQKNHGRPKILNDRELEWKIVKTKGIKKIFTD